MFLFGEVVTLTDNDVLLVYDGECPACSAYTRMVDVRDAVGELRLVNARDDTRIMEEVTALGIDIDEGMVLKVGTQLYVGADAIHALALLSSRSGTFNALNYWVFRSRSASTVLYPALRGGRNLLLKVLGRSRINNLNAENNDVF